MRVKKSRLLRQIRFLITVVLLVPVCFVDAVEVESKTVEVTGQGLTIKEAITDGLIEAMGQVSGRIMEAEQAVKSIAVTETTDQDESFYSSQQFEESIKSATKGAVKEYSILEQSQNEAGRYEVRLSVVCLKVVPGYSSRKKVVCGTFLFQEKPKKEIFDFTTVVAQVTQSRNKIKAASAAVSGTYTAPQTPESLAAEAFTDNLEAYLVQSRRFMVQDRRKTEELAKERDIILTGTVSIEDVLKATYDNPADLVVVGDVGSVDYVVTTKKMRSGRVVEFGEGFVEVVFRIVDVPSKQVKYSDRVRYTFTDGELREMSGSYAVSRAGNLMMSAAADRVGKQILEAIYPLKVINVSGDHITLNEGGRGITPGQIYDVFSLGEQQFDPYTKEKLGRLEIPVGRIKIARSSAKMSAGTMVQEDGEVVPGCVCRLSLDQTDPTAVKSTKKPGKKISTDDLF